jgi:hypothetical protein
MMKLTFLISQLKAHTKPTENPNHVFIQNTPTTGQPLKKEKRTKGEAPRKLARTHSRTATQSKKEGACPNTTGTPLERYLDGHGSLNGRISP